MLRLPVIWTRSAEDQRLRIVRDTRLFDPDTAHQLALAIERTERRLSHDPHAGQQGVEPHSFDILIGKTGFVLSYILRPSSIQIIGMRPMRRPWTPRVSEAGATYNAGTSVLAELHEQARSLRPAGAAG